MNGRQPLPIVQPLPEQTPGEVQPASVPSKEFKQSDSELALAIGYDSRRPKKMAAFLQAYAACGHITRACEHARIGTRTHYNWLREAKDFPDGPIGDYPELFQLARKRAIQRLEDEAFRRALDGLEEPVIYKGQVQGHWELPNGEKILPGYNEEHGCYTVPAEATFVPITVPKKSDRLLTFLLRAHDKTYRAVYSHEEEAPQQGGPGGPTQINIYMPDNGRGEDPAVTVEHD